jgi:hypothetical protein
MNTEHKKNFILTLACIVITYLSVTHYDSGIPTFFHVFYELTTTYIELVIEPPFSHESQPDKMVSVARSQRSLFPEYTAYLPAQRLPLTLTTQCLLDQASGGQQLSSPIQDIISFLHKKQIWHTSSDEDPLPHHAFPA